MATLYYFDGDVLKEKRSHPRESRERISTQGALFYARLRFGRDCSHY